VALRPTHGVPGISVLLSSARTAPGAPAPASAPTNSAPTSTRRIIDFMG
jgi:hypothetical protein